MEKEASQIHEGTVQEELLQHTPIIEGDRFINF
jgi:hypothetical protein